MSWQKFIKKEGDLPEEKYKLGIAVTTSYEDLKGVIEALLQELHIEESSFTTSTSPIYSATQAALIIKGKQAGVLGKLKSQYQEKNGLKSESYLMELDFETLISHARTISTYHPLHPFAIIKLDYTVTTNMNSSYETFKRKHLNNQNFSKRLKLLIDSKTK